jgi:hypothetical protein
MREAARSVNLTQYLAPPKVPKDVETSCSTSLQVDSLSFPARRPTVPSFFRTSPTFFITSPPSS